MHILFECRACDIAHSGGTLQSHLLGTAALLERWDQEETVILAGLMHSMLGPGAHVRLDRQARQDALEALGARGLRAVILFALRDRTCLYRGVADTIALDDADLAALAHLTLANALEQITRLGADASPGGLDMPRILPLLTPPARRETAAALAMSA